MVEPGREPSANLHRPDVEMKLDLGFGKPISQSSVFSANFAPERLIPGNEPGSAFFHTVEEEHPWLLIDLGATHAVGEIRVWNREGARYLLERAIPLEIAHSTDGETWIAHHVQDQLFRGRRANRPLSLRCDPPLRLRYLRLTLLRRGTLHFDYVEVLQHLPALNFGYLRDYREEEDGSISASYQFAHNDGLFANFSALLADLIAVSNSLIRITSINTSRGFSYFKSRPGTEILSRYALPPLPEFGGVCDGLKFDPETVHMVYRALPLAQIGAAARACFPPTDEATLVEKQLLAASGVVPERTLAIVYRGTDKVQDVRLAPVEAYIAAAAAVMERHPELDILIQTDQQQARDLMIAAFPNARLFDDVPVTQGALAIHRLEFGTSIPMTKEDFVLRIMAATRIISRCAFIINHTGNLAAWIAFYRGTAKDMYQFNSIGELVPPP